MLIKLTDKQSWVTIKKLFDGKSVQIFNVSEILVTPDIVEVRKLHAGPELIPYEDVYILEIK